MTDLTSSHSPDGDFLARAVALARRGDMRGAREAAELGLRSGAGQPATLHAFLGMVCARAGERAEAATHLKSAHEARPEDVTIACNLIAVLMEDGRDEDALAVATEKLAQSDASLRIARYRGFLAQKLEDFEAAVKAYELVLAKAPRDFECLNNIGNARAGLGDHAGAVEALRRAIEVDPDAAPSYLNLSSALIALERNEEAEEVLKNASTRFRKDSRPPYQLYVLMKSLLKQEEALAAVEQAAERDPNVAGIQLKLAIEYGVVRRTREAERAYRRTIELDPVEADAYLGLAIQYEHMNREEEFAPLLKRARENGLSDGHCAFIETLELRRMGRFEEGLARLESVPKDVEPIRTAHIRATLLERLMRTDEAFAAFAEANRLQEETPTDPIGRAAKLRAEIRAELDLLTPAWRDSWRKVDIEDDRADPVFLVGFPRSGTTLLDTILMGHAGALVMEEQPPLNIVEQELGGMAALPTLDAAAVAS
ncbi:MAG TPA: tetratricopeptide repeat protein, partial [Parvularculaceae bacterium]|nr:tetratricopeptide repeat protein [Parvularculaceae bacterium]